MSILDNITIFSSLSEEERNTISLFCQERKIEAWKVLFNEWEDAEAMYIVTAWQLEAFQDKGWTEKMLWTISEWEFVWEMALLWEFNRRSASVRSKIPSTLITILKFSIIELESKHPEVLEKIRTTLRVRVDQNRQN